MGGVSNVLYELLQWAYGMNEECYRLLIFRYTLLLCVGCYLSLYQAEIKKSIKIASAVVGASFIVISQYFFYEPRVIRYWTGTSWLSCLYIMPIVCFFIKNKCFKSKVLEYIGKASFEIFLVQLTYYSSLAGSIKLHAVANLAFNIIFCCIIGIIFYKIEAPLTLRIYKLLETICKKGESINWNQKIEKHFGK